MRELNEPHSIIESAEQAAAAGDYTSAEELLRKAALLQEARLGPLDPDLANTLNNLGVVCEMNGKPVDAEECFRRALSIATQALEPDHPFVATSRQNLRDFCEAHGKPLEVPTSSPAVTIETKAPASVPVDPPRQSQSPALSQQPQPRARTRSVRPLVIGALGPGVMLIVILVAAPWVSSTERDESSPAIAIDSARRVPVAPRTPPPVESTSVATQPKQTTESGPTRAVDSHVTTPALPERPTVAKAQLCAELEDWLCDPPDRPIPPGQLFFYTQVKSPNATTLQHRWYHGDRLQQSVDFRVDASRTVGYRVSSRYTMKNDSAGNWKVELRTKDGTLLHEERFAVR
jgi:Protein of unknown function (DUF2914)/Tetratricopeptide repeat